MSGEDPAKGDDSGKTSDAAPTSPIDGRAGQATGSLGYAAGDDIGPYHLLQMIGEGGFGEVWLAERRAPIVQRVAMKVIRPVLERREILARFQQERQALALLEHSNIARIFDAGETERGWPYFVMEYVAGEPITDYADRHMLSVEDRLRLFIPVCDAVQHAHMRGIIHRDIKPSNVLVEVRDGQAMPKVIDFGVAKAINHTLAQETVFTERGVLIGTPEYMSPEQAEMSELNVDTRTDVYSLGVLLYELLTGTVPFERQVLFKAGIDEIRRVIRNTDPPRPSTKLTSMLPDAPEIARRRHTSVNELVSCLRSELEWIPLKALQKDRTQRYESASELRSDVCRYLDHEPLVAGPDSAAYTLYKFIRRNRAAVGVVAAVGAAVVLGLGAALLGLREARRQETIAGQQRDRAEQSLKEAEVQKVAAQEQAIVAARQRIRAGKALEFLSAMFGTVEGVGSADGPGAVSIAAGTIDLRRVLAQAESRAVREFVDDRESLGRISHMLGNVRAAIGEQSDAIRLLRQGSTSLNEFLGQDDPEAILATNDYALALRAAGRLDEAEDILRNILPRARLGFGADHPETATMLNNLGELAYARGDLGAAKEVLTEALKLRGRQQGEHSAEALNSMMNLSAVLAAQGDLVEAEQMQRVVVEQRRTQFTRDDRRTLSAEGTLATTLYRQGKREPALEMLQDVLKRQEAVLGADHEETLQTASNTAQVLMDLGRTSEAEPLFRRSVEGLARTLGPENPLAITAANNLGTLLLNTGRTSEALPLLEQGLQASLRVYGADNPETVVARNNLGRAYQNLARMDEALAQFEQALATARQRLPRTNPWTLTTLNNLGYLHYVNERYEAALALFEECAAGRLEKLGPEHPQTLTAMRNQACALFKLVRYEEAEAILSRVLPFARSAYASNPTGLLRFLSWRGQTLTKLGRFESAEKDLLEGWAIVRGSEPGGGEATTGFRRALHDLYTDWGKPDKAAEFAQGG